jgi:hypothetical protein
MKRIKLSDEEWTRILASLKKLPGVHIGLPDICRQFVNAILWILLTLDVQVFKFRKTVGKRVS